VTRLLHVIPEDGLGGAEIAAHRAATQEPDRLTLLSLAGRAVEPRAANRLCLGARSHLSPLAALRAGWMARDYDVAVFSLWKSILAMLAAAVLAPRTRRVLFLHSDRRVHLVDRLATMLGLRLAHQVWADSERTLAGLGPPGPGDAARRVISFILRRPAAIRRADPRPRFIFWGRLHPLKRVDRAIALFARLAEGRPDARLLLIGPDAGSEAELRAQVRGLGLEDRVDFAGTQGFEEIAALAAGHDIFLQLSEQEGAAMSLIEAMQLGLVPVVTPVGEMGAYVRSMRTGIVYGSEDQAVADLERLLADPALFAAIGAAAVDRWAGGRLYHEDVMMAAADLARREG
jgi:glycosyltransferase involved in cell wall biosynthesis